MEAKRKSVWALLIALGVLVYCWRAAYVSLPEDLPLMGFLSQVAPLLPAAALLGAASNSFVMGQQLRDRREPSFSFVALSGLYLPVPLLFLYVLVLSSVWFGVYKSANRGMWLLRLEVLPLYGLAAATFITIDFLLFKFIDLQRARSVPSWLSVLVDGNIVLMLLLSAGLYAFAFTASNVFALAGGLIVAAALSLVWALKYAVSLHR
ncbi:MAG: hypothetical protein B1H03_04285 [Planctomycetales bacterium 4484_113]|nr:MAG: hypothetical protein B1H03_04285 [Planctomycetales bacterium 4484_113]